MTATVPTEHGSSATSSTREVLAGALEAISACASLPQLEQQRLHYLGKKGLVAQAMSQLRGLALTERSKRGSELNLLKDGIVQALAAQRAQLEQARLQQQMSLERIDVTLPGKRPHAAHLHPITITRRRVAQYFTALGYQIVDGPEIESDYYNFASLNFKPNHPARDMQDTFFLTEPDKNDLCLLRTHTSNMQMRMMEQSKPPIRTVVMGRVYRCDSDITHTPMFHQLECVLIDRDVSFAHLKATLTSFVRYFFEQDVAVRLRPSFFPFTEPSAEVDIQCVICTGKGCRVCKETGWLEILGSGLVHPNVLGNAGIDTHEYSGFAFGMGLERITMLRYQIDDLRLLFTGDWEFLRMFH